MQPELHQRERKREVVSQNSGEEVDAGAQKGNAKDQQSDAGSDKELQECLHREIPPLRYIGSFRSSPTYLFYHK